MQQADLCPSTESEQVAKVWSCRLVNVVDGVLLVTVDVCYHTYSSRYDTSAPSKQGATQQRNTLCPPQYAMGDITLTCEEIAATSVLGTPSGINCAVVCATPASSWNDLCSA